MDGANSRDLFETGHTIMESEPWVYSVLESTADSTCYRCLKKTEFKLGRCTGCSFARYCSQDCQKSDWAERHKSECNVIGKMRSDLGSNTELPIDIFLILCKMIAKIKRNDVVEHCGEFTRSIHDLMSHSDRLIQCPTVPFIYHKWKPYLDALQKKNTICRDLASFATLYGKFVINGFFIADYFDGELGRGLYLGPSIFDHSCDPNAIQIFDGKKLIIKAIRPIKNFTEVRISYDQAFNTIRARQEYLERHYFFTCQCVACTDSEVISLRNAFKCAQCHEALPLRTKSDVRCPKCGEDNGSRAGEVYELMEELNTKGAFTCESTSPVQLNGLLGLIEKSEKLLHPTNFHLGLLYMAAYAQLGNNGKKELSYAIKALPSMKAHINMYESSSTGALADIFHCLIDEQNFREAAKYGRELVERLAVIPGRDSSVYREYSAMLNVCEP